MFVKKLPLITTVLIIFLIGFIIYCYYSPPNNNIKDKSKDTASASTIEDEANNNTNNTYVTLFPEYNDNDEDDEDDNNLINDDTSHNDVSDIEEPVDEPIIPTWKPATEMDLDPTSLTAFINKEYCLPKDYIPKDMVVPNIPFDLKGYDDRMLLRPEAAESIELLFNAAHREGLVLYGISGYRSYNRQKDIFLSNIVKKGKKHTLLYSAVPGTSEHQTGLAMDVSSKTMKFKLISSFANSLEGKWLYDNAHYFGFIIRYPKDKVEITGYEFEPWHIRYVGKDLATYLYDHDLTLEEYYNYSKNDDFDFEAEYADLINYIPPTPIPTPIPTPTIPPEDGDEEVPPDDGDEDVPPDDGDEQIPPDDGDEDVPPDDGDEQVPPEDDDEEVPPDDGDEQVPPDDGDEDVPPDDGDEQIPPDDGDEDVPPDDGNEPVPYD